MVFFFSLYTEAGLYYREISSKAKSLVHWVSEGQTGDSLMLISALYFLPSSAMPVGLRS